MTILIYGLEIPIKVWNELKNERETKFSLELKKTNNQNKYKFVFESYKNNAIFGLEKINVVDGKYYKLSSNDFEEFEAKEINDLLYPLLGLIIEEWKNISMSDETINLPESITFDWFILNLAITYLSDPYVLNSN